MRGSNSRFMPGSFGPSAASAAASAPPVERSQPFEMKPTGGEWREFEVLIHPKAPLLGVELATGGARSRLEIDSIVLRFRPE